MSTTLRQRQSSPAGQSEKAQLLREADEKEITEGQQFILPNFTVKQLLDAIPAHCFHRSAVRSSLYVVQDAILIGGLVYAAFHIDSFLARFNLSSVAYQAARITLYGLYTFAAGLVGTGVWIIGHECGHQGYSSSKRINYVVGWVLHSFVLVPFHSWRISHSQHHAATGHLTRDQVFVPRTRKERGYPEIEEEAELDGLSVSEQRQADLREAIDETPLMSLWNMVLHQVFGWPLYIIKNASGQLSYPAGTNHFSPKSIIFKDREFWHVVISDVGIAIALGLLAFWGYKRSFAEVAVIYGIPYLWVNNWLVMITFLQHTDPVLPHYSAAKWTFARGALATIDRTFMGPIGGYILHGICETHVAHHISSKIPHYNAWEATDALKAFLGPHYHRDDTNMLVAFWRCYRECRFVEDGPDVVFFKNASGVAKKIAVEEGGNISDSGIDMTESKQ